MEAQNSKLKTHYRYIIGFVIFSLSFGVYLSTLCPTVSDLDSGELISVCYTLGIAHPAGYPLYALLGKLFTLLPIRTVAFRVNLMSAFFASLTAALVYFVILKASELDDAEKAQMGKIPHTPGRKAGEPGSRLSGCPAFWLSGAVAASAGLVFAFSRAFWSYAVITEVYTMKAFFLVLLILILLTWRATQSSVRKSYLLWVGAFIYGLSLGTRITMILFGPAFLLYIVIARERKIVGSKQTTPWSPLLRENIGKWVITVLLFLLGSSIYLYLPIRSLSDPPIDWGDPENWSNFLAHVTGKQFRFMLFNVTKPMLWSHIKEYIHSFAMQFSLLLYPIGIIGAARFLRKRKKEFTLLASIYLIDIIFNLFLYTGIYWLEHFFMSSFAVFAIWMGWGMKSIMDCMAKCSSRKPEGRKAGKPAFRPFGRYALCFMLLAFAPVLPYMANHDRADQSQNWDSYDYGKNILDLVEDNAVIMTRDINPTFPVWYFQYVEERRPDVTVIDVNLLTSHWFYRHLRGKSLEAVRISFDRNIHGSYEGWLNSMAMDIVSRNVASRPFYFTFKAPNISNSYVLTPRFYFMSIGPVYQLENHRPKVVVAEPSIQHKANIRFSDCVVFLGYDAWGKSPIPLDAWGKGSESYIPLGRKPESQKAGPLVVRSSGDMKGADDWRFDLSRNPHRNLTFRRGEVLQLTYYWRLLDGISNDLTVDILFTDAEGNYAMRHGVPRFHHIHELVYDLPLADIYGPGQMIKEEYKLVVPSGIAPGRYYMNVGVCIQKAFLKTDSGKKTGNFVEVGMADVL